MKKYNFTEQRIYVAEIKFNCKQKCSYEVFEAFLKRFPEYEGAQKEVIFDATDTAVVKVFKESCFDFVEE